jgi:hypothetical protein
MIDESLYVKPNQFVLLSTAPDEWYVLRAINSSPIVIDYAFQTQEQGFSPMNIFGGQAGNGLNSYIVDKVELAMSEFTNVTNILSATDMAFENTNITLQIFLGISPSFLRVFRYYPSNDNFNEYLTGSKVHWGGRERQYDIGYIDGFQSPRDAPTSAGEIWMPPTSAMEFTLMNPALVFAYPQLKLYINQLVLEPVSSASLASKILDRIVPSKIAQAGAFPDGFTPTGQLYGVDAVPLTATEADLKKAGYR